MFFLCRAADLTKFKRQAVSCIFKDFIEWTSSIDENDDGDDEIGC